MPANVIINSSSFDVMGHVDTAGCQAVAVPSVSIFPAVGPTLISATACPTVTISTEACRVFHSSTFDILLDRTVHLSVCAVASVNVGTVPHIELETIHATACPSVNADTSTNSIQISGEAVGSVDVSARSVVPDDRSIRFGTLTFQHAKRSSPDKISPITESKLAEIGISEPRAFSRVVSIIAETDQRWEHDELISLINSRHDLSVYGIVFPNAYISGISDIQLGRGGLNRFEYTVEFTHYVLPTQNTVTYAGISVSHPTRSAPDNIAPSYAGNTAAGCSLTNLVATIQRTWTFECVCTDQTEYTAMISLIGMKGPLVINGESFPSVYVSGLSHLVPRGTGIYLYTAEFQSNSGDDPVPVTFAGISLPNATDNGGDVEIIKSRTTLNDGRVAADIGLIAARSYSYSCMSNSKADYYALFNLIAEKTVLVVDGETIPKGYISQLSSPVKRGTVTIALYTWDIGFEEDTS